MKKIQKIRRNGNGRRLVKQLFLGLIKRKHCHYRNGIERLLEIVEDIQGSVEIMAMEMARKAGPKQKR